MLLNIFLKHDNTNIKVGHEVLKDSSLINNVINISNESSECDIPISCISHQTMNQIIAWSQNKDNLAKLTHETLKSLIVASDYLEMEELYTESCKVMARSVEAFHHQKIINGVQNV